MLRSANTARRTVIWLAYLGLACRMLIPAGYMPAPLSHGGPVVLCHGGLSGQLLKSLIRPASLHEHAHGGSSSHAPDGAEHAPGGSDGQHAAWEHCPVGTALAAVALTGDYVIHLDAIRAPLPEAEPVILVSAPVTRNYWARAPPRTLPS